MYINNKKKEKNLFYMNSIETAVLKLINILPHIIFFL